MRDPRYDILFEPLQIGPVKTRNRFYQVPHCTGMGHRHPNAEAANRGAKAQGGWGVVSTQEAEIHASSDLTPANEARIWDERDIPALRLMTDAVHEHGSLAAIQLAHNGSHAPNLYSREPAFAPSATPIDWGTVIQAREMDKSDIKNLRRWFVEAALRAKTAGFDIIYAYAGHDMTILQHFLLERHNKRTDEYGGNFENRMRLFREVVADLKDAVGDTCAIAIRLAVDELMGAEGLRHDVEGRDIFAAIGEEPDLWDVNLSNWQNDSQTSRFSNEGFQEPYTAFVKSATTKPVVGVGRYTSPDSMVRVIKSGHLDLIGAARPSIADPFLPNKIEEGRIDDIRECIGCNICTAGDNTNVPMRCTQNPTVGEEWRRGWHPEIIQQKPSPEPHLIVGSGPAGLEAARVLAKQGSDVTIAEARDTFGGRVTLESQLPGLSEWARVRDWRLGQINPLPNVNLYAQSPLSTDDILEYGIQNVVLATGATWRRDGFGRTHRLALPFLQNANLLTPDDLMHKGAGAVTANGPVVVFDDDTYYMGSVLAELLANAGHDVTFVTPQSVVAPYTEYTLEQDRVQARLIELGVKIKPLKKLADMTPDTLTLGCVYSAQQEVIPCATLVMVTSRLPNDGIHKELMSRQSEWADAGLKSVTSIGDSYTPGIIASATQAGYRFAMEQSTAASRPHRETFVGGNFANMN